MRSLILAAAVLALAGLPGAAADRKNAAKEKATLVDPLDFRKPISEPEELLVPKYGSKLVRFTGLLVNSGEDRRTKRTWHDLRAELPQPIGPRTTKPGVAKPAPETVLVRVYLRNEEPRLRAQQKQVVLTVEGTGQLVGGVWSLEIEDAAIVDARPLPLKR